jgi:serine/threonine protein kinase
MVKNKIIHRAIKPQNILLEFLNKEKSTFLVKLKITYDCCFLKDSSNLITIAIDRNNLRLYSPEILKKEKSIEKSDLWSLGILIYFFIF